MLSTHSMLEEASVSGLAEEGIEVSVSLNVFTINARRPLSASCRTSARAICGALPTRIGVRKLHRSNLS